MSIRDALTLKNAVVQIGGQEITLRRPSALDMIDAVENSKNEKTFAAWLVKNHLLDDGKPMFNTLEEVLECDGILVAAIAVEIDKLYGEGRD